MAWRGCAVSNRPLERPVQWPPVRSAWADSLPPMRQRPRRPTNPRLNARLLPLALRAQLRRRNATKWVALQPALRPGCFKLLALSEGCFSTAGSNFRVGDTVRDTRGKWHTLLSTPHRRTGAVRSVDPPSAAPRRSPTHAPEIDSSSPFNVAAASSGEGIALWLDAARSPWGSRASSARSPRNGADEVERRARAVVDAVAELAPCPRPAQPRRETRSTTHRATA
jgi:hypothetical protein